MRIAAGFAVAMLLAAAPALALTVPDCNAPGITPPKPANDHAVSKDDYPVLSVALGEQGYVTLALTIGPDGHVSDADVDKSSGSARLDDAAAGIARSRWLYTPPLKDGQAISCRWKATVNWHLAGFGQGDPADYTTTIPMGPDAYPPAAKAAHEEGQTRVLVGVDEDGRITLTRIGHSSGYDDLDLISLTLASNYKFSAGRMNGKFVKTTFLIIFDWRLDAPKP
jgi:TonB family protein